MVASWNHLGHTKTDVVWSTSVSGGRGEHPLSPVSGGHRGALDSIPSVRSPS